MTFLSLIQFFFHTSQIIRPNFPNVVLVDPGQLIFLVDTKSLKSGLKDFFNSLVLNLAHSSQLVVEVGIPVDNR